MLPHRRCLALFLLFCFPSALWAEVKIKDACRVRNRPPGRCGWCAVETLARHHHLKVLYDLSEANSTRCCVESLQAAVAASGVNYHIQFPGENDSQILRDCIGRGLGAAVGFHELYPGAGRHIVTLIDMTADSVKVIDSNDPDCHTRTMSMDRFLYWWDGFAMVLEPTPPSANSNERVVAQSEK